MRRFTRSTRSVTRFDAAEDACSAVARTFAMTRAGVGFFFAVVGFFDFDPDFDLVTGAFFMRSG